MYKNQLQELAQRSCFNLPSYVSIREGPDHAPRFKATVNFNGETYESPNYCTTLRQAEHSAAEVALNALASRGPSNSLAARILDETGVYKNLLQEVSQRVGASLPTYTTFRSGLGHLPIFTCTVELAGCTFTGEPAKNKKQAEKNAAMSAWSSLKLLTQQTESSSLQKGILEEQEHVIVARALQKFRLKARMSNIPFPIPFPSPNPKPHSAQSTPSTTSKILPLICPKTNPRNRPHVTTSSDTETTSNKTPQTQFKIETPTTTRPYKFPAVGAAPYIPVSHFRAHHGIAAPVTIRNAVPVFAAPPLPIPHMGIPPSQFRAMPPPVCGVAPPVTVRQAIPVYSAPNISKPNPPVKPSVPVSMPAVEDKGKDSESATKPPVDDKGLDSESATKPPVDDKGKYSESATKPLIEDKGKDSESAMKSPATAACTIEGLSGIPKEDEAKLEENVKELQI